MSHSTAILDLDALVFTAGRVAARSFTLGGSDANIIASGDAERIHALWSEKTGRTEPEDLSGVLPVVMGSYTEPLNAAWYQRETGLTIKSRDLSMTDIDHEWRTATLDGLVKLEEGPAVWEAKHVNAFSKPDEVLTRYLPQLHHNMDVAGVDYAVLSVLKGTTDFFVRVVERDADYAAELLALERAFWASLINDKPPVALPAPKVRAKEGELRVVDMTGSNEWADAAERWSKNLPAKKAHDDALKDLKTLVEEDVKTASGHGVIINRDARGALRVKEDKK